MKKTVLIVGSSGMTGSEILRCALASSKVSKVIAIDRKKLTQKHKKLTSYAHADFSDFSSKKKEFSKVDVAFWCVGVYTGAVPRDEFYKITVTYLQAFAKQLKSSSKDVVFCLMSAMGADQTSSVMFAKDKGVAEKEIEKMKFKEWYAFRPAYIYPTVARKEPNLMYVISQKLSFLIKWLYPAGMITSRQLATFMFETGLKGSKQHIFENKEMLP